MTLETNEKKSEVQIDTGYPPLVTFLSIYLCWIIAMYFLTGGSLWPDAHAWSDWLLRWQNWDGIWYERIYREGYSSYPRMLVFPPLYSWIVGTVHTIVTSVAPQVRFAAVALILNLASFFGGGLILSRLASERFRTPPLAFFIFFLSAPTAYFAFCTYSDALFILLFAATLRFACHDPATLTLKEKLLAAGLALLAPWARLTGYAFTAWILLRRWFALAALVSLGGWLLLNFKIAGDPFYFLEAQELFAMPQGNFLDGLRYTLATAIPRPNEQGLIDWTSWLEFNGLPLFYLAALCLTSAWFAFKRDWILALSIAAITVISHNQSFWRSVVRYDLPLLAFMAIPLLDGIGKETLFELTAPNPHGSEGSLQSDLSNSKSSSLKIIKLVVFITLMMAGFAMQICFARLFRLGEWAF